MATYRCLKHLADRREVPLNAVVREALRSYVASRARGMGKDPLLRIVGRLKLGGRNWSERKDWRP